MSLKPNKRVFILAAGTATRFNGCIKQLLPINGEAIIERTVRQIHEFDNDIDINIITNNRITYTETLYKYGVRIINAYWNTEQLSDTILGTCYFWCDNNIILLGDVIYDTQTLHQILQTTSGINIFYRDTCIDKNVSERFALTFSSEFASSVATLCNNASKRFKNTSFEKISGLSKICYSTKPEWKIKLYLLCNFVFKRIIQFNWCGITWFKQTWKPEVLIRLYKVDDNITTDIDTLEEYYNAVVRML